MIFRDLLSDPDCPDCRTRGWTYSLHCQRCVARHIARETPALAEVWGRRLIAQLDRDGFRAMQALISEEREADRKAAA